MRLSAWSALLGLVPATALACATSPPEQTSERAGRSATGEPAATSPANPSLVALGRFLFHDRRISRNRDVACSNCHTLSKFGVDGKPAGIAASEPGGAPTEQRRFNTRSHVAQVWDARASNASAEAIDAVLAENLGRVPLYVELFRAAFPKGPPPISLNHVSDAIEAFERGLVSGSRWDKFLAGDVSALTIEEKNGLRVFLQSGCVACHSGPQVGGTLYREVGIAYPWPNSKAGSSGAPDSLAARLPVRVPSLKNIADTAPYFRDSSVSNLEAAIRLMGHHQLGVELSSNDVNAIAAWMHALSGDVDPAYIAVPDLPPEG
jgi:cytochrome c peroxidase